MILGKTPISEVHSIGPAYAARLKKLDIYTVEHLIYHFPFRYDDFSKIAQIVNITLGEKLSIVGNVWQIKNIRIRSGKFITKAIVADQTSIIEVIWFNQPYLTKTIKAGTPISLSGKVEAEGTKLKMISPTYELIHNRQDQSERPLQQPLHTGRLVPIYPETEYVSSKWLRSKIALLLPEYLKAEKDFLPEEIKKRYSLINLETALGQIHFPKNLDEVTEARQRLSFDELLLIQLTTLKRRLHWKANKTAPMMQIDINKVEELTKSLPFMLTDAQDRVIKEILDDLRKPTPANRLLQGDVGSGKTVVAAVASFISFTNGFTTLLAAPTEILTFQHQKTLKAVLGKYGIKVGIWTGSKKEQGDIICGTHALLHNYHATKPVGLVIVDEQHRFGVAQRGKLFVGHNQKQTPHLLTMTATPIPRTTALTLYGDLDLSVIDEMPQGRKKIATYVVPNNKREAAYQFIEKQILAGHQAFIITPFVEPSETMTSVKAAIEEFAKLKNKFSKGIKLGLLHGRLSSKEKERQINKFKKNQINILVATPVVEVGIDVAGATVMMIESAERFGLAQLHQLRGRVGRGDQQSYCLLFTITKAENSIRRLKSMERVYSGLELAEIDLKIRGPGEVLGLKQSGFTNLKIADLADYSMVASTQTEAKNILESQLLTRYPLFEQKVNSTSIYIQPN